MSDVSDIREGTHSYGFVLTGSLDKHQQCMCVIASQGVINIELTSEVVRNIFADRLRKFILFSQLEYNHFN